MITYDDLESFKYFTTKKKTRTLFKFFFRELVALNSFNDDRFGASGYSLNTQTKSFHLYLYIQSNIPFT